MEYAIYKMEFPNGVHFGNGNLDDTEIVFQSDTLFSALYQEAIKMGDGYVTALWEAVTQNQLHFTGGLPFVGDTLFLPKPICRIAYQKQPDSSAEKKRIKKMKYVALEDMEVYLNGCITERQAIRLEGFAMREEKTSAAVRGEIETVPYRVGICHYRKNSGLYLLVAYKRQRERELLEELLDSLSWSGIGGKRSAGLGRFTLRMAKMPKAFRDRLSQPGKRVMTLCMALPEDGILEQAMQGATWLLLKRSGFVASADYSPEYQRKKDSYVFAPGSCFEKPFEGCIEDVSVSGAHPVYRYEKPLFVGV